MVINHNIAALNTYRQLNINSDNASKAIQKLSSGLRINSASDDAAGLTISEKMKAQVNGLDQASRNAQDGISMVQTAEGALNETTSILQRMRELSDQSANGTNTDDDRKAMQDEVTQLKSEIDRIGNTTEFNTQKLLDGGLKAAGGASVGQNITTGNVIGKLDPAKTAGVAMAGDGIATADFKQETVKVDGSDIAVNWQNLSTDQQNVLIAGTASGASSTEQSDAKDLVVNTINSAIDASGKNVAHVAGWVDTTGNFVLQSGSSGTTSSLNGDGAGGIADKLMNTSGTAVTGTNVYNGTTVASGSTFSASINGVQLQVTTSADIQGGTTAMSDPTGGTGAAEVLQTSINTAIDAYNTAAGAPNSGDSGHIEDVKVNALDGGSLQVLSESGPVSFSDASGSTNVSDLGLNSAQTDATGSGGMTFQIGANKGQSITFGINDMRSAALGISGVDVSTAAGASSALTSIDTAIKSVSSERAKLGAVENRLEHTINNLGTSSQNLTAAQSRITDVDMASEMTEFTKDNILSQAAQAMLAQANQQPQGVLQLLR